jgi:methionyl-tRNA formyltransferase
MKLIFMGTPEFAVPALEALIAAGHEVAAIYTQPPRPSGRGQRPQLSPVHEAAAARGIAVRTPASLRDPAEHAAFAALGADAAVVAAYGLILPPPILAAPRFGCLNLHASLLPRWRGAAPIARAIEAGDAETGMGIMRMEAGLDTGPVLLAARVPIGPATDAGALHDTLAALGARLIVEALAGLAAGTLGETPQPADGVTYARKIDKAETRLDWRLPAALLERRVRAFHPAPGAWFEAAGGRVKVLAAELAAGSGPPGTVLDARLTIACGADALRVSRVQPAGKPAMAAADYLRGRALPPGTRLPLPAAEAAA